MEILQAIEQLRAVQLLKTSFVVYPVVNAMHIAAIGALFTSVVLMDLAMLGIFRSTTREHVVPLLRRVAGLAFVVALLTGLTLFSIQATTYAGNPAFLLKLVLIGLAILNFVVFVRLDRSGTTPGALRASALASMLLWSAVLLCGRFIGFL